jgi:hypothetical protein
MLAFDVDAAAYAFMGYASNELFDARYTCGDDELAPPRSVSNFNATYPDGYEGNQVCPLTSGTAFAVNDFDLFDVEELRWIMLACVVAWWFIFTVLAYLALRFVRYTPLPAAPMAEMEADDNELSEIDLSKYKKQHKGKAKFDGALSPHARVSELKLSSHFHSLPPHAHTHTRTLTLTQIKRWSWTRATTLEARWARRTCRRPALICRGTTSTIPYRSARASRRSTSSCFTACTAMSSPA